MTASIDERLLNMRLDMIDRYLGELCKFYKGPKKPMHPQELIALHKARNYKGMVKIIRDSLLLSKLDLILARVKSGGPKDAAAWIHSKKVPPYGTVGFTNFKTELFIRESYISSSSPSSLVAAVAHELSHVVLDTTKNPLRDSEIATELTAMMMGYHEFFLKEFIERDKFTYLSRAEIQFAHQWITKRLR